MFGIEINKTTNFLLLALVGLVAFSALPSIVLFVSGVVIGAIVQLNVPKFFKREVS